MCTRYLTQDELKELKVKEEFGYVNYEQEAYNKLLNQNLEDL